MYEASAKLKDGRTLTTSGSIEHCAQWADSVIRENGTCEISIMRVD